MSEKKEAIFKWYVASTQSGQERTVSENISKRLASSEKADTVARIIVAEIEEEVLNKKNEKVLKKRNLYPGYIFIEMEMSDEIWFLIRNTPGVTGFIGSSGRGAKPFPVDYEDIEPILKRLGHVDNKMYDRYKPGDYVRVIDGPLVNTEGRIVEIDRENNTVRLEAVFFGRVTNTVIEFRYIEMVQF